MTQVNYFGPYQDATILTKEINSWITEYQIYVIDIKFQMTSDSHAIYHSALLIYAEGYIVSPEPKEKKPTKKRKKYTPMERRT